MGQLQSVAKHYGLAWRQPGTSHVTFHRTGCQPLTVPSHKPIKAVYVVQFTALIDAIRDGG